MIPLVLLLLTFSQKQIKENPVIIDGINIRYASEYILITTPVGIYTFDRSAKTWKSITTAHGLPANDAHIVGLDQGIMWVATEKGLASADIRLNDWQTYSLPGQISGLTFDDNYVWVTGDFGLKRLDKYIEVWEDVDPMPANDILYDKTYFWLATGQGIRRYNPEFEKIEEMYAAPKYDYYYILETQSQLWFLADEGFVAYERNTESWFEYTAFEVTDYASLGDSLFIVSGNSVLLYNPATNSWGPFVEVEGLNEVNGISISPRVSNYISFATNNGLLLYDWFEKTRKTYNRSNGLYNDTIIDVYESSESIFAIGKNNIQYLDKSTNIWQVENLVAAKGLTGRIFYYDEAGLHADIVDDFDIRLEGRAYYSLSTVVTDSTTWSDYSTINLQLIGQHESDRIMSLYYDDTDKEDTLYGFGYRGLETDFLYRASGGFIESEYYEFDLVPTYSILGANARLRHDAHSLMLQGGQLKSSFRSDFFYGRSFQQHDTILDIQYSTNTFYRIAGSPPIETSDHDTIFIDDRLATTNSIDTRIDHTIAGITGDFDPLINGLDYFIDYSRSFVQLLTPASDSAIITLKYNGTEIVIQSDSERDNLMQNVYWLGPNMVPGSLKLDILDTTGVSQPLSDFLIDDNNDGFVDPVFINYELGYLIFPEARPFPYEVYAQGINVYLMDYEFSTQSLFYRLSERPVLIGSEKVLVDGEQMIRDYHYIIDYTLGTVLFLREEAVNDFSEVEIQYVSVERQRDDLFYAVQPNMKIGNNLNLAPGYTVMEDEKILHASARYATDTENASLLFVPQLAANQEKEFAHDYLLIANYHRFTFNANYRGYSDEFESFGLSDRRYGRLRQRGAVSIGFEPVDYVRLNTSFKKEWLIAPTDDLSSTQYMSGRIDYLNPNLPNGFLLIGKNILPDHEKIRLQLNTNYNLQLAQNRVRFNSVVRQDFLTFETDKKKNIEYILNTNLALRFPVQADFYLHGVNLYVNDNREKDENEMRLALNVDVIPGLYYTGNYRQKRQTYYLPESKDVSIMNYFYNNLNVAPGRWYSPLSIINFSVGNGTNFDEYLDNLDLRRELPSIITKPLEENIETLTDLRTVYAKVYLTPFTNLNLQLKRAINKSGAARYDLPILRTTLIDEIRAEYEQARIGYLTAVFNRNEANLYPVQTTQNLYMEWTKPWSAMLRTKLSSNIRKDAYDYETAQTEDMETSMRLETLLRFGGRTYVSISLAGRRQERYVGGVTRSILPGCSINLNVFEFLFMQFDYEANVVIDASTTHLLSAKITGSF